MINRLGNVDDWIIIIPIGTIKPYKLRGMAPHNISITVGRSLIILKVSPVISHNTVDRIHIFIASGLPGQIIEPFVVRTFIPVPGVEIIPPLLGFEVFLCYLLPAFSFVDGPPEDLYPCRTVFIV